MKIDKKYCEICSSICPNGIEKTQVKPQVFAAYSSHDREVVREMKSAMSTLNAKTDHKWLSWQNDLEIENKMIFC